MTRYHFIQVKPDRFFGIEDAWVNESRITMTDPERGRHEAAGECWRQGDRRVVDSIVSSVVICGRK